MKKLILSVLFVFACVMMFEFIASADEVKPGVVAGHAVLIKEHQEKLDRANCALADLQKQIDALKAKKTAAAKGGKDVAKADAKIAKLEKEVEAYKAKIAKLEKEAAGVEAGKEVMLKGYEHQEKMLDKMLDPSVVPADYKHLLPTESPIMGIVRKDCPDGTSPAYKKVGVNEAFSCVPLKEEKEPVGWGEAFGYCALGGVPLGVAAGAGNFYIGAAAGNHVEAVKDGVLVGVITTVVAIPTCAVLVKIFGR